MTPSVARMWSVLAGAVPVTCSRVHPPDAVVPTVVEIAVPPEFLQSITSSAVPEVTFTSAARVKTSAAVALAAEVSW